MSFRFSHLKRLGNRLQITMPTDPDGFLGRECPNADCLGYFKIKLGTGLTGEDLPCHCPYCGHTAPHDNFWTSEQIEYAKSIALRKMTEAIQRDLKQLEFSHPPRGPLGIGISLKVKPGVPVPIRYYREKLLETSITCDQCGLQFAIYGLFAFCPDCRDHNSLQILDKNLDLTLKELGMAEASESTELSRHLIEDALENCVSALDGFGRESCRIRAKLASDSSKATRMSFQNLDGANERLKEAFGIDLKSAVALTDWNAAFRAFHKRHVVAHRSGIADGQYIKETGDTSVLPGRIIPLDPLEVRAAISSVRSLGHTLTSLLPPP